MKAKFFYSALMLFFTLSVSSQPLLFRVNVAGGLGGGLPQKYFFTMAGNAGVTVQKDSKLFSLSLHGVSGTQIFGKSNVYDENTSVALTYGTMIGKSKHHYSVEGGISHVHITRQGAQLSVVYTGFFSSDITYEKVTANAIGFPVAFKMLFFKGRRLGMGAEAFAEISKYSSFGIMLSLHFGKW